MPLIIPANSAVSGGFEVANSLRFNQPDNPYLTRTISSAGSTTTISISFWFKRGKLTDDLHLFSSNSFDEIKITGSDTLRIESYTGGYNYRKITNRLFRDPSAWYHMLVVFDTSNGTADDRIRLYINGVRETSFSTSQNPSQNFAMSYFGTAHPFIIATDARTLTGASNLDGYLSEVVALDGSALDPTSFGEFDEDSGIWKPISVSGLTFGTNGFYLDFQDSSALGNDAAGSNNFTSNNLTAIDQSTDTCTNNFATLNPLHQTNASSNYFLEEGNLQLNVTNNDSYRQTGVTIHPTNFKGYFEFKNTSQVNFMLGFQNTTILIGKSNYVSTSAPDFYYLTPPHIRYGNGGSAANLITNYVGTISEGDIVGCAFDFTGSNKNVWFHVNGTYGNNGSGVGNPSTGANPALTATQLTADEYEIIMCINTGSGTCTVDFNFGSPSFAISSGNADGDGYGNFEYAVPSGYYSLNTKNLAEYG